MSGLVIFALVVGIGYVWPGSFSRVKDGNVTTWSYRPMWWCYLERQPATKQPESVPQQVGSTLVAASETVQGQATAAAA